MPTSVKNQGAAQCPDPTISVLEGDNVHKSMSIHILRNNLKSLLWSREEILHPRASRPRTSRSLPGLLYRLRGVRVIPVVSLDLDRLLPEVMSSELPLVRGEVAVLVHDLGEVTCDVAVEADLVPTRNATEVTTEVLEATKVLLEGDGLDFDVAEVFCDDPK